MEYVHSLVFLAPALLALASSSYAATPPKKAVPPTSQSSVKPAAKAPLKTAARPRAYSRYRAPVRYVARPAAQQVPTADRYKEIQQAMADKGYFKGNVDGQWNQDSVDALKHFQTDQNLPAEGRLDSLSLIGLGLGPKRMTAQSAPQVVPPASQIEKQ
jgi:peptidoglycan hydrolase-like protein with peptidoglycan-binding domain